VANGSNLGRISSADAPPLFDRRVGQPRASATGGRGGRREMALRFELLFSHLNLCRLTEFAGRARDDDQVSTRIIPFSAGDLPARAVVGGETRAVDE
jgi:hypothetical protein